MIKTICIRYTLVFIASMIAIGIISYILKSYFDFEIGSSGTGIVSVLVPALDAGMAHYRKSGEAASASTRWAYARYFTGIQIVFSILVLSVFWIFIPELISLATSIDFFVVAAFLVVYLVVIFLASRYFFGFGINTAEKAAQNSTN